MSVKLSLRVHFNVSKQKQVVTSKVQQSLSIMQRDKNDRVVYHGQQVGSVLRENCIKGYILRLKRMQMMRNFMIRLWIILHLLRKKSQLEGEVLCPQNVAQNLCLYYCLKHRKATLGGGSSFMTLFNH